MIMRPGQQLLLPANPLFIWSSLLVAMVIGMLPLGRVAWMPDLLALVLVFWSVHQPLRVGIGAAFLFGIAMDVHQASLLGQHALAYTALSFFAITIHRRLLWFTVPSQAVQVLPLGNPLRIAEDVAGTPPYTVPLVLALEYAQAHREELERTAPSPALARRWVTAMIDTSDESIT